MKEDIIEKLKSEKDALDIITINDLLGLKTAKELAELSRNLEELVNEFIIYHTKKDKYILYDNLSNMKIGKLAINKKGNGFVIIPGDDLYIDKANLNGAVHDDVVLAEIINNGVKFEGKILKIVKRELKNIVGEIKRDNSKIILSLDDDKKDIKIEINEYSAKECVDGSKVLVEIVKELGANKYLGNIIKIIGHKDDPGVDILSIAYKYGIYDEFNEEVLNELSEIPVEVRKEELINRTDLTEEEIFTIDGDDTKDIDDAISLTYDGDIYRLGVHIADVSNYVKENTALGNEAYNRATSSYLADTVIPMLPHKLSNGICSLNEGVIRLTMSCVMDIDKSGKVINYDIFPSFIKSKKKMTYKKVNDIIERGIVDSEYVPYKETLLNMKELADILRKEKIKRGYIDFELDEAKIIQDETGRCVDVIRRIRESGEMMIEDFMIAANETVASHIFNMHLPFIYRIHENPKPEKIEDFINLVKQLGYHLTGKTTDLKPKMMQELLDQLRDKKEFPILSSLLLRSMAKAEYNKENLGHFGLASRSYTHFTSPIRRYPDLTVHRLLKKYLVEADMNNNTIEYFEQSLPEIASHSSEREVAAVNAEREVDDMKMAEYMEAHIGEEYDGIIDSVTNFGMFVELDNLIEGLVHMATLKKDYFVYVPELLSLIGKSTKKTYRIGDKVRVKVVAASKENATIDFELVEDKNERDKK